MRIELPNYRELWKQAKKDNRRLRSELAQARSDLAMANARAYTATERAEALEKANDKLRADLNSWLDKAVSSDG